MLTRLHATVRSLKGELTRGDSRITDLYFLTPERVCHRLVQAWALAVPLVWGLHPEFIQTSVGHPQRGQKHSIKLLDDGVLPLCV